MKDNCYRTNSVPRNRVIESFRTPELDIPISRGMSVFVLLRGQWNLIDALWHCASAIDERSTLRMSFWPRLIAVSKGDYLQRFLDNPRVGFCRLVLNSGDEKVNTTLIGQWQQRYGCESIRHTKTHAKIATVAGGGWRFLLRGSMNLGHGTRFEQCDITEGGTIFDCIEEIEASLPRVEVSGWQL